MHKILILGMNSQLFEDSFIPKLNVMYYLQNLLNMQKTKTD